MTLNHKLYRCRPCQRHSNKRPSNRGDRITDWYFPPASLCRPGAAHANSEHDSHQTSDRHVVNPIATRCLQAQRDATSAVRAVDPATIRSLVGSPTTIRLLKHEENCRTIRVEDPTTKRFLTLGDTSQTICAEDPTANSRMMTKNGSGETDTADSILDHTENCNLPAQADTDVPERRVTQANSRQLTHEDNGEAVRIAKPAVVHGFDCNCNERSQGQIQRHKAFGALFPVVVAERRENGKRESKSLVAKTTVCVAIPRWVRENLWDSTCPNDVGWVGWVRGGFKALDTQRDAVELASETRLAENGWPCWRWFRSWGCSKNKGEDTLCLLGFTCAHQLYTVLVRQCTCLSLICVA